MDCSKKPQTVGFFSVAYFLICHSSWGAKFCYCAINNMLRMVREPSFLFPLKMSCLEPPRLPRVRRINEKTLRDSFSARPINVPLVRVLPLITWPESGGLGENCGGSWMLHPPLLHAVHWFVKDVMRPSSDSQGRAKLGL